MLPSQSQTQNGPSVAKYTSKLKPKAMWQKLDHTRKNRDHPNPKSEVHLVSFDSMGSQTAVEPERSQLPDRSATLSASSMNRSNCMSESEVPAAEVYRYHPVYEPMTDYMRSTDVVQHFHKLREVAFVPELPRYEAVSAFGSGWQAWAEETEGSKIGGEEKEEGYKKEIVAAKLTPSEQYPV
ncbi:MAG: hypothetical protein MMC33_008383 [Icmadophila ericetorum]|nr:hypothetical protein [Icmadophila ericetorum]